MGLGVAFVWGCLSIGFGVVEGRPGTGDHCLPKSTCKGAERTGPPSSVAVPVRPVCEAGYAITACSGRVHSTNVRHGFQVTYRNSGFDIEVPGTASAAVGTFTLMGIGKGGAELPVKPGAMGTICGERLEWDHGTFRMVYANSSLGMRHDVVVEDRPEGEGRLEARFRLGGNLVVVQPSHNEVVFHRFDPQDVELVPVVRYSGLLCYDATGRELPSTMELHGDQLVLAVADAGAVYPVTIDPLSSTPNLEIPGTQAGENFGQSVATAGDVNGDGYSDVLVGSPNWNTPAANAGRVQLFLGSASGLSATAAWTVQGSLANDRLGFSTSSAGDINGDGFSDVAVGAPGMSTAAGRVLVFMGSSTGLSAGPAYTLLGNNQLGCEFGWSVALAGDVNGDGFSDLLVGAPKYNNGLAAQGKAYCYHGAAATLNLGWSLAGIPTNAQFGYSVAGAGDLNGDGYSDAAIGAPFQAAFPASNNGVVRLYSGNAGTGLNATANQTLQGAGNAWFGFSLSSAGDMNGDGYADLLVGAPGISPANGAVYLHLGSSGPTLVPLTATSSLIGTSNERLGYSVALAGDVNSDGFGDVVLGSPEHSSNFGRARVYRGGPSPLFDATHLYWTGTGSVAAGRAGTAVGPAGDVNGDGISDVLVGAPGQGGWGVAKVFHGVPDLPATTAAWTVQGTADYQHLGQSVASAGDVNGDGYSDLLVGIPGSSTDQGRVQLFLGSATGLAITPVWSAMGENLNDGFGHCVASAGDVNGDGYSDVLVGAPRWPMGVTNQWRGKAYLFLGNAGGLAAAAAWTKDGPQVESRFGYSLSGAGDVNGDGYSDVLIGAYTQGNGAGTGDGAAYVFHGSGTGLPATADWAAVSEQHAPSHTSTFGVSVAMAGDVNGDGYDDVIIGDNFYEHAADGVANRGGAFVYHGSASGLSAAPDWAAYGAAHGDEFGTCVGYAGDVNADGISDVVIGAQAEGASYQGRAYVYHGAAFSGLAGTPAWSVGGFVPGDRLGTSVGTAGDVNGDGFADVIIGTALKDWSYVDGGGADVFLGSPTGLPAGPAWAVTGAATGQQLGACVALAGDVNGDGYSDLAVGGNKLTGSPYSAPGYASVYLGNRGLYRPMPSYQYRSDLATPVRTGNGTFQSDCEWGIGQWSRSTTGRTKVKLVWHVAGHGPAVPTNFFETNSTAFTGEEPGWTDSGLSGTLLQELIMTTAGVTGHPVWRVRVRFHRAMALDGRMFGRWYRQGVHDLQVPSIKTELAGCGPLPVILLGATVQCASGQALLAWSTGSEQDCAEFLVERSSTAQQWETIGRVACAGNSSQTIHYTFTDPAPPISVVSYYRLRQVDINGAFELFPAMPFTPCGGAGGLAVWPNPCGDELFIAPPDLGQAWPFEALVRDMSGRVVAHHAGHATDQQVISLQGLARLAPGVYWVELRSSEGGALGRTRVVRK